MGSEVPYDQYSIRTCLEKYVAHYEGMIDKATLINYCYDALYVNQRTTLGTGDISELIDNEKGDNLKRALENCTNIKRSFETLPTYNNVILENLTETISIIDAIYTPYVCFMTYLHGEYNTFITLREWFDVTYNSVNREYTSYDNNIFNDVAIKVKHIKKQININNEYKFHVRAITLFGRLTYLPKIIWNDNYQIYMFSVLNSVKDSIYKYIDSIDIETPETHETAKTLITTDKIIALHILLKSKGETSVTKRNDLKVNRPAMYLHELGVYPIMPAEGGGAVGGHVTGDEEIIYGIKARINSNYDCTLHNNKLQPNLTNLIVRRYRFLHDGKLVSADETDLRNNTIPNNVPTIVATLKANEDKMESGNVDDVDDEGDMVLTNNHSYDTREREVEPGTTLTPDTFDIQVYDVFATQDTPVSYDIRSIILDIGYGSGVVNHFTTCNIEYNNVIYGSADHYIHITNIRDIIIDDKRSLRFKFIPTSAYPFKTVKIYITYVQIVN